MSMYIFLWVYYFNHFSLTSFLYLNKMLSSIIATPGRFLHVIMEMDLKLSSVEYVVFDEADRLTMIFSLEV